VYKHLSDIYATGTVPHFRIFRLLVRQYLPPH